MIVAGEVEAKNFVLYIGHLRGEGSQWCNRLPEEEEVALMRRILMVLAVAALLVAMVAFTVAPAFAKQATTFQRGTTTVHQGNSTHSPVIACHHGAPGSNGSAC
jgi:hypothetical protein